MYHNALPSCTCSAARSRCTADGPSTRKEAFVFAVAARSFSLGFYEVGRLSLLRESLFCRDLATSGSPFKGRESPSPGSRSFPPGAGFIEVPWEPFKIPFPAPRRGIDMAYGERNGALFLGKTVSPCKEFSDSPLPGTQPGSPPDGKTTRISTQ